MRNVSAIKTSDPNASFYPGNKIKDLTKRISHLREKDIKLDSDAFLKHDILVDNKRNADIEVSVLEQNKTFSRKNNGAPVRYM